MLCASSSPLCIASCELAGEHWLGVDRGYQLSFPPGRWVRCCGLSLMGQKEVLEEPQPRGLAQAHMGHR